MSNKRRRFKAKRRRADVAAKHRAYGYFNDTRKRELILAAFKPFVEDK